MTGNTGTPQKATNSSQTVIWSADYEPFGTTSTGAGITVQDLRLPGQEWESETGHYQNGFRDYIPGIGRYLESDPIGLEGGLNTYAYVENNPVKYIDPDGLQALSPSVTAGRLPPWLQALMRTRNIPEEALNTPKEVIPRISGADAASDVPSWCRGMRPMIRETGKDFAKRVMDEKYGPGNYERGPGSEFSRIQKYGDRNFRVPKHWLDAYDGV